MTRPRRTDTNQAAIVAALEGVGASVVSLHEVGRDCPDLVVGFHGRNWLLEIKNKEGRNRVSPGQRLFQETWRGQTAIVRTVEEALAAIGVQAMKGAT